MRACICTCAYAHIHIFTPTSTHEMRTRTHVHKSCLRPYANAACFFDANLEKMPAALENGRRGPKAASSNFEHKPWKPQNGVKVTDRSKILLKHRNFFRTTFIGIREAGRKFRPPNTTRIRTGRIDFRPDPLAKLRAALTQCPCGFWGLHFRTRIWRLGLPKPQKWAFGVGKRPVDFRDLTGSRLIILISNRIVGSRK